MGKKNIIVIILVAIVCLAIGGVCSYFIINKLGNDTKCETQTEEEKQDSISNESKWYKEKDLGYLFDASELSYDSDCEYVHYENDGTEEGKETWICEVGYLSLDSNKYYVKLIKNYDGESKTAGYSFELYINDKLVNVS